MYGPTLVLLHLLLQEEDNSMKTSAERRGRVNSTVTPSPASHSLIGGKKDDAATRGELQSHLLPLLGHCSKTQNASCFLIQKKCFPSAFSCLGQVSPLEELRLEALKIYDFAAVPPTVSLNALQQEQQDFKGQWNQV